MSTMVLICTEIPPCRQYFPRFYLVYRETRVEVQLWRNRNVMGTQGAGEGLQTVVLGFTQIFVSEGEVKAIYHLRVSYNRSVLPTFLRWACNGHTSHHILRKPKSHSSIFCNRAFQFQEGSLLLVILSIALSASQCGSGRP